MDQVEGFQMLLQIFAGSLLPYVEGLDSWLFDGTLDDPFGEVDVLGIVFMFYVVFNDFLHHRVFLYKGSKLKV